MATETIEDILNAEEDMTQKYLHFVLKGNTPLLMHNPAGSMTVSTNNATRGKRFQLLKMKQKVVPTGIQRVTLLSQQQLSGTVFSEPLQV